MKISHVFVFIASMLIGCTVTDPTPQQAAGSVGGTGGGGEGGGSTTSGMGGQGGCCGTPTTSSSVASSSSASGTGGGGGTGGMSAAPMFMTDYCIGTNVTDPNPGIVNCECAGKLGESDWKINCSPSKNPDKIPAPGDQMTCQCMQDELFKGICFGEMPQPGQPQAAECNYTGCCGAFIGK